ncbi:MAG: hypothetical protein KF736_04660 [Acidobacteria bacterium]|nr:hypothetical protein [Acidobacteriota bacterium]MCW5948325.1 hypothetical protein [Pyrinomonadaceae bacterium]
MSPNFPKLIFAAVLSLYFLWIAWDPMQGSFLDNVDLPIHEFGHLLFRPLGEFMMIAGGSIFQAIFPLVFAGYFLWQRSFYSAAIVGLWVGQSILNVWVYASDAVVMQLMLTSGMTGSEGGFHDWNYMLTELGWLGSTRTIAGLIRAVGTLVIVSSALAAIYASFMPTRELEEI